MLFLSLKAQFPWLRNVTVVASLLPPVGRNLDISVTFDNISLSTSSWFIQGLNLHIYQTQLLITKLFVSKLKMHPKIAIVNISYSTFGILDISGNFGVMISHCTINGMTRQAETFITIKDSKIKIISSLFHNNKANTGPAILIGTGSQVMIQHSIFVWNYGYDGLIEIHNGSNLRVYNCTFERNKHWFFMISIIVVRSGSSADLYNCTFFSNAAAYGAALCSFPKTRILIRNCHFLNNTGQRGGIINCHDQDTLEGFNKTNMKGFVTVNPQKLQGEFLNRILFSERVTGMNNNASMYIKVQPGTNDKFSKCVINGSVFQYNYGIESGGSIYVQGRYMDIRDSSFKTCNAGIGGAIRIYMANMRVKQCLFENNVSPLGGSINIEHFSTLLMEKTLFNYSTEPYASGAGIMASGGSKLKMNNSYFINDWTLPYALQIYNFTEATVMNTKFEMTIVYGSMVLYSENNVKVNFTNCTFHRNTGIYASDNTFISVENSTFRESHGVSMSGIIFIRAGSHIYFTSCNFIDNYPPVVFNFMAIREASTLVMKSCLYANNTFGFHFMIDNSKIILEDCRFCNNNGALSVFSNILFQIWPGQVSVSKCVFKNNTLRAKHAMYESIFFYMIGDANFTDTVFINNAVEVPIKGSSPAGPRSGYVQIKNCTFDNDARCLYFLNVAVINIENSVFRIQKIAKIVWPKIAIFIQLTKRILIAYSQFETYPKAWPLIEIPQYNSLIENGIEFLTLKSNITNGEEFIESDSEDFMKNSTRLGFIIIGSGVNVEVQETKYASSMYHYLILQALILNTSGFAIA